jgi:hypothetical protein
MPVFTAAAVSNDVPPDAWCGVPASSGVGEAVAVAAAPPGEVAAAVGAGAPAVSPGSET